MNHGKNKHSSIDDLVERINRKLFTPNPKNNYNNQDQSPSNRTFLILIVVSLLFMWGSMGIILLPQDYYAVVLTNGKVSYVSSKNSHLIFSWPYPFGKIHLISAKPSTNITINSNAKDGYLLKTKDNQNYTMELDFRYKVSDPYKYYMNFKGNVNQVPLKIETIVQQVINEYFISQTDEQIHQLSQAVIASAVRDAVNQNLSPLGLTIEHLSFDRLTNLNAKGANAPANSNPGQNSTKVNNDPSGLVNWHREVNRERGIYDDFGDEVQSSDDDRNKYNKNN